MSCALLSAPLCSRSIWTSGSSKYKVDKAKREQKQISHHVVFRIAGHSISDAGAVICYEKQRGLKRIKHFNQINALMSSPT